jgi:hypothetical protein
MGVLPVFFCFNVKFFEFIDSQRDIILGKVISIEQNKVVPTSIAVEQQRPTGRSLDHDQIRPSTLTLAQGLLCHRHLRLRCGDSIPPVSKALQH